MPGTRGLGEIDADRARRSRPASSAARYGSLRERVADLEHATRRASRESTHGSSIDALVRPGGACSQRGRSPRARAPRANATTSSSCRTRSNSGAVASSCSRRRPRERARRELRERPLSRLRRPVGAAERAGTPLSTNSSSVAVVPLELERRRGRRPSRVVVEAAAATCGRAGPPATYWRSSGQGAYFGLPRPSCSTSMIATHVSSPIRSASASGPIGCAKPSFAIVSIASGSATPSMQRVRRLVDERHQDPVRDEAGEVVRLAPAPCRDPRRAS